MKASLDREGLRLGEVTGKTYDGQLSGLFELKNTDGTGLFSAQLKLTGSDLGLALAGTGLAGRSDITASVSATGKSVGGDGGGTLRLRHGAFTVLAISGVNPDAFAAIIARADAIGRDVDVAKTAAFVPSIAGRAHLRRKMPNSPSRWPAVCCGRRR